ncbi:MAG: hypothetical protein NVSMB4_18650 [Acidimicrobiales bacterium]
MASGPSDAFLALHRRAFAYAALGAVTIAAQELLDHGTYSYLAGAAVGAKAARAAFGEGT